MNHLVVFPSPDPTRTLFIPNSLPVAMALHTLSRELYGYEVTSFKRCENWVEVTAVPTDNRGMML